MLKKNNGLNSQNSPLFSNKGFFSNDSLPLSGALISELYTTKSLAKIPLETLAQRVPLDKLKDFVHFKLDASMLAGKNTVASSAIPKAQLMDNANFFTNQWHVDSNSYSGALQALDVNVRTAWQDFTGKGVRIAVVDNGIQYERAPGIAFEEFLGRYDANSDINLMTGSQEGSPPTINDNHGTAVAGLIAGNANGIGTTGMAYGSFITSFVFLGSGDNYFSDLDRWVNSLRLLATRDIDVSNNSWGFAQGFGIYNLNSHTSLRSTYLDAINNARDGLGSLIVQSAGNNRYSGDNTANDSATSNRFSIIVAATNTDGTIGGFDGSSANIRFSTPGANLLISAPGGNAGAMTQTVDRPGEAGYSSGDYTSFNGTSAAAPIVSGAVALMLEANPNLGYRDVQEILAYSARHVDDSNSLVGKTTVVYNSSGQPITVPLAHNASNWQINGATNWNGGGMFVSHDYGMGLLDTTTAVRLAETWEQQNTGINSLIGDQEDIRSFTFSQRAQSFGKGKGGSIEKFITVREGQGLDIDNVEVQIHHSGGSLHTHSGDLIITLTSPDGTVSRLMNRPDVAQFSPGSTTGSSDDFVSSYVLTSKQHWGEQGEGVWKLTITDAGGTSNGVTNFTGWTLNLYGDTPDNNDTYIYTNEFAMLDKYMLTSPEMSSRQTLIDSDGGIDAINAATIHIDGSRVTSENVNSTINLSAGSTSMIAGKSLTLSSSTLIEKAFSGDGDDILLGNALNNYLNGGRGDDFLDGKVGNDILVGGQGNDTYLFSNNFFGHDIVNDISGMSDFIDLRMFTIDEVSSWTAQDSSADSYFDQLLLNFTSGSSLTIQNFFDNSSNLLSNLTAGQGNIENIAFQGENPQSDHILDFQGILTYLS